MSCLHLQCPGCGATRALAALLHGHVIEAMNFNALITLLLPFAAAYGIVCYIRLAAAQTHPLASTTARRSSTLRSP